MKLKFDSSDPNNNIMRCLGLTDEKCEVLAQIEKDCLTKTGKVDLLTFLEDVDAHFPDFTKEEWCAVFYNIGVRHGMESQPLVIQITNPNQIDPPIHPLSLS